MPDSRPLDRPNPRIQVGDSTTTLTYALRTDPSPLTVSLPDEPPLLGTLQLVVTNPLGKPVDVAAIGLTLDMGTDATDLATTSAGIGTSVSDEVNWKVTPPSGPVTDGPATWLVGPTLGDSVPIPAGASIVIELDEIPINQAVGTTPLSIVERLADGTRGDASFQITKFPYGFYFDGLIATVHSGSELVPVAQVANGTAVTLLWNCSVVEPSAFTVLYTTNGGQQTGTVSTAGEWTSPGLARDTVFVVQVRVTSSGGESLTFALATSVAVREPDLDLNSATLAGPLAVHGAAALSGGATVGGTLDAGPVTASGLTVNGNASASALAVTGQASAGSAQVSGQATLGSASVTGALDVTGTASLGNATVAGLLAAAGTVGMCGNPQGVGAGSYTAKTDGYVVGAVNTPSDISKVSIAWIWASSGGATVQATGGNVCFMVRGSSSKISWWYGSNPQSFILPVRKGNGWSVSVQYGTNNELNPPVAFYWIPIGVGAAAETFEKLAEAPPDAAPPANVPESRGATSIVSYTHEPSIEEVMAALSDIFGDMMSAQQRAKLQRAIRDLVLAEGRDVTEA